MPRRLVADAASTPTKPGPVITRASANRPSAVAVSAKSRTGRRTTSAGTAAGRLCTRVTRGAAPGGTVARVDSMTLCRVRARAAISASSTRGPATVSINAAVSPKSFTKLIGPAPSGRSLIVSSFSLMSSNSFPVSGRPSTSVTNTAVMPVRVLDSTFSTLTFSATFSSSRRVISCSIFSALAPGHGHNTSACRIGISGSLRCGIWT